MAKRQTLNTLLGILIIVLICAGCVSEAPTQSSGPPQAGEPGSQGGEPRGTLRVAWRLEPGSLSPELTTGSGVADFFWVFNSYLTYYDFNGVSHPMLARAIPTQEGGDWLVNDDGTMQTTYRLRESARWHDMAPVTAHDYVFGFEVHADPEIPVVNREVESMISRVHAADDHTLVISWNRPYIQANKLGYQDLNALPRHLLETKYRTNKSTFIQGEEWTSSYVGNGPFRIESWTPGSGLVARAHPGWALGPPKLELIEIRFISDAGTLLANLLAGEIDVTSSPAVGVPEALVAREQWVARGDGDLKTWATRLHYLEFQYRDVPNRQPAVGDLRVRQAMTHAVDRQALADAVTSGLGTAAEAFVSPQDPLHGEVDRSIKKYPYDPNRSAALLAEAGWNPGAAGLVRDAAGQTLDAEIAVTSRQQQAATVVADYWKSAGINSSLRVIPPARERDREFRASFRAAYVGERTASMDNFYWTTAQIPSAETRFAELNRGGFSDPQVDHLNAAVLSSFDPQERSRAFASLHQRMAELAGYLPLMFPPEVLLARRSVKGPVGNYGPQPGVTWNVFEWEIAS